MRAICKVTSGQLLTKQAMRKKNCLLLLAHGPGVGVCFLIGGLAVNGFEAGLSGCHIELSCLLRLVMLLCWDTAGDGADWRTVDVAVLKLTVF
jgi:hypothetical protein